jgi:hypothetical protein
MRHVVLTALLLTAPAIASAQQREPLPVMVVDIRGFYTGLGQDPITAAGLLPLPVDPTQLPTRGLGGVGGVHFYPLRWRRLALGLGGEGVLVRARAETLPDDGDDDNDDDEAVPGEPLPIVNQRMMGLTGIVSLNFGHRDGWSYVSAGMGPLSLGTYRGDEAPPIRPPMKMTIVLAAGARWFAWRHVAFGFDLRFYQTRPQDATVFYPARQRANLRVLSAGVSFR